MNWDQIKMEYEEAMRMQGVSVTWAEDGGRPYGTDAPGYTTPENWVATLSRNGVVAEALVSLGTLGVTGLSPAELARRDILWTLQRQGQLNSPQGELPDSWFATESDDIRRFYEVYPHLRPGTPAPTVSTPGAATRASSPGPATTVPIVGASIQSSQAPPNPSNGTTVNPGNPMLEARAGSPVERFTFWQWNYFWQQRSGRSGPSPEEVGVASGTQIMTGAEWVAAVGNWYGTPVSIPPTTGSPTSSVGGTPTVPPIVVGGTGTPPAAGGTGGGSTGAGGTPPAVGGTGTGSGGSGTGGSAPPTRRSFWEWNALHEQSTKIVGADPAAYGIMGTDLMTFAEWQTLTAAYYASQGDGEKKGMDSTMLLLVGAVLFVLLVRR